MDERLRTWMHGFDTGLSSQTIAAVMEHNEWLFDPHFGARHPQDPADLGRCLRLLDLMPEWKPRMGVMRTVSPIWSALVDHWSELEQIYNDEFPKKYSRKCYDRMREIIDPLEQVERKKVRT